MPYSDNRNEPISGIQSVSRTHYTPRIEFEEKAAAIEEKRGINSYEMVRTLVYIYCLRTQDFNRTFFERNKSAADEMYQTTMETTVLGKNFAGVSWRAGISGSLIKTLFAFTSLNYAAQGVSGVLDTVKESYKIGYDMQNTLLNHKIQVQRNLEDASRDAIGRIRNAVAQLIANLQKMDSERSSHITTMNRSS